VCEWPALPDLHDQFRRSGVARWWRKRRPAVPPGRVGGASGAEAEGFEQPGVAARVQSVEDFVHVQSHAGLICDSSARRGAAMTCGAAEVAVLSRRALLSRSLAASKGEDVAQRLIMA
jgi:hypothetical protein